MGFHFPPEIEWLRQQSNLELQYGLSRQTNIVVLPIGAARETKGTAGGLGKASIVYIDVWLKGKVQVQADGG
jgi:hypothetical protein